MKIQNKTFLVTGAGSGMGREIAQNLIAKGAKVIAIDINQAGLDKTVELARDRKSISTYLLDISEKDAVATCVEKMLQQEGHIDGLINNAGIIQPFVRLNDLDYRLIEKVFNVNFFGTLYLTKALIPYFLSRPEAQIVNISSMGGFLPVPGQTIYGASKAAVKLMTEGLAQELKNTNIKVSVVFPGAIGTNIMKNSGLDMPSEAEDLKQSAMVTPPTNAFRRFLFNEKLSESVLFLNCLRVFAKLEFLVLPTSDY